MAAVLKSLMPALSVYYPAFAARFGTDEQNIGMAMSEYAERLDQHDVTGEQFLAGIEALKALAGEADYYPNPERFALLCKQALGNNTNGLPTLQDVMAEIIQRRGAERHNSDWQFSHELIRLINQRKGGAIYELTSVQFENTIKAEYDHWCKRITAGESLPQPLHAIEQKPAEPEHLKGVKPTTAMAKRIEAMRKAANERKALSQTKLDCSEVKPC
jgi:hypothetical protein